MLLGKAGAFVEPSAMSVDFFCRTKQNLNVHTYKSLLSFHLFPKEKTSGTALFLRSQKRRVAVFSKDFEFLLFAHSDTTLNRGKGNMEEDAIHQRRKKAKRGTPLIFSTQSTGFLSG